MALKNISKKISIKIILIISVVILCYGFVLTLFGYTLVNPLTVIFISLGISMVSALPFALKWSNMEKQTTVIFRTGCYIVAATGISMALLLGINYFAKNSSESYTYEAKIEKIFSETAYRRKRVGNRYYANGEPYKNYYMVITMPDGKNKKFPISTSHFNKYAATSHISKRRPKSVKLTFTPGAFGWHVMGPLHL